MTLTKAIANVREDIELSEAWEKKCLGWHKWPNPRGIPPNYGGKGGGFDSFDSIENAMED